jgi:Domain of unknown function (DUF5666)
MRKLLFVLLLSFGVVSCWGQEGATPGGQTPALQNAQQMGSRRPGVAGTITAINTDSLSVKTINGQTAQVNLSANTQYRKDRQPAKLTDFKVGDQVFVRGEAAGENNWQADMVAAGPPGGFGGMREGMGKEFIAGEIKAINGTQLTILRPDGVTQNITVDESTSFRKQGQSVTLADFQVGDHVFGRGQMKNDVFVPSVLNAGEMGMGRGRGQGQGAGSGTAQGQGTPDSH